MLVRVKEFDCTITAVLCVVAGTCHTSLNGLVCCTSEAFYRWLCALYRYKDGGTVLWKAGCLTVRLSACGWEGSRPPRVDTAASAVYLLQDQAGLRPVASWRTLIGSRRYLVLW